MMMFYGVFRENGRDKCVRRAMKQTIIAPEGFGGEIFRLPSIAIECSREKEGRAARRPPGKTLMERSAELLPGSFHGAMRIRPSMASKWWS